MTTFCDASLLDPPPVLPTTGPRFRRTLRRLLWHRPPGASIRQLAEMRWLRDLDSQQASQPGPYCAIEAGPVLLVLIDTGILGGIDRDQGAWLRRIPRRARSPRSCLPAARSTPTVICRPARSRAAAM